MSKSSTIGVMTTNQESQETNHANQNEGISEGNQGSVEVEDFEDSQPPRVDV